MTAAAEAKTPDRAGSTTKRQAPRKIRDASNIVSGKKLLDTARVCDFLSISDDTLTRLIQDPEEKFPIDVGLVGGKRHWTLESLERYVARKEKQAQAADRR